MSKRKCKYCNSDMDLMEFEPNYEYWVCLNEDCSSSLTLDEYYLERWEIDEA